MSASPGMGRRTILLLAGVVSAKALDFALYVIVARQLGVAGFGLYTFALSFVYLFNVLADLGVTTVLVREVARRPERTRRWIADALLLKAPLAVVTLSVTLAISFATGASSSTLALVAVFTGGVLLNSGAGLFEALLKASGRGGSAGLVLLAQSTSGLAVGVWLVGIGTGALGAACAYLCAAVVHVLAAMWVSRDLWRSAEEAAGLERRWPRLMALGREALPLALSGVFIAIYFRIDAVMLQAMKGPHAVGLYGGIYRLLEAFAPLSAAYQSLLLPVLARSADGPAGALAALGRKSLQILLLCGIGAAVFVTFWAGPIVELILGPAYADAAPGLAILFWALPPALMSNTLLNLLIAQRRQAAGTWIVASTAGFNVALNLVLIPRLSFLGAAMATVASEMMCFTALLLVVQRRLPTLEFVRGAWRPLAAGSMLAGTLVLVGARLPSGVPGLLWALALSIPLYGGLLVLLGALRVSDMRTLFAGRSTSARRLP